MAQEALLSFALLSSSAERPSTSRRLTSLPSVAPTMRPVEATTSTTSGSGLFHDDDGMHAGIHRGADRGHRLRLGEDLRVGADADLEILAPGALLDQHLLQARGLGRAGLQPRQVVADQPGHLGADRGGGGQVAARAFLDDAFQHGNREGDAGGLDRLQIDRREQPGLACDRGSGRRVGEQVRQAAERFALRGPHTGGGIGGFAQVAHGRD